MRVLAAVLLVLAAGCSGPERPGPNVQEVPKGFRFDANAFAGRQVFLDVEPLDQSGWFAMDQNDNHSSIMITTYTGQASADEIRGARQEHASRWGRKPGAPSGSDYGPIEETVIDGRAAWAWEIRQYLQGDLCSIEWVAVVPYDTTTYAVEFYAGMDEHMDPELIRETVTSFRAE